MPRNRQRVAIAAAGCAGVLALAGAAVAAIHGHAGTRGRRVVTVTEREYHIALSTKKLSPGTITFSVHNAGRIAHQLDLSGAGITGTAHVPTIKPGKTRTITVTLTGGTLALWCPLPGHAALGMKTSVKLAGATTGAGGATTTTPTDTSGDAWG
jgi:hypothetical protein